MGWGKQNLQASSSGAGPYAANYNRAYDSHTQKGSNNAFTTNPPSVSDVGPYEFSGLNAERKYVNPTNHVPDQAFHGSLGYLGDAIGPREIQTGNAPSGGYATLPFSYTVGFQKNAIPDNRRMAERNRADDWEHYQKPIHVQRDAEQRLRRSENVDEDWATMKGAAGPWKSPHNGIEDSPYRRDWPDAHMGPGGAGGSATYHTNPNKFVNYDVFDSATNYKTSGARYLNGTHYSMAVHQTLTPYVQQLDGGTPVRTLRNTYRLDPQPWDATNTDGPSNTPGYATTVTATSTNGGLPTSYGSSYRLT
jgi:hypothetical protein